ncbi:MAG: DNA polymerase IV, partial [Bdellovibrionota bacterium]
SGLQDKIRGIVVKLKFTDFTPMTRERVFEKYPSVADFKLLLEEAYNQRSEPIRLLGIGVRLEAASSNRTPAGQLKLF